MKVAITGATGGLGRSLVDFLLSKNVRVVALGRNREIGELLTSQGAEFHAGDISNELYLCEAFAGVDAVIHCAGLASPFGAWEDFYHANVLGTQAVLNALTQSGVRRLIHISTPSVYFSGVDREAIDEESPLPEQKSFYGQSKLMADELVLRAVQKHHLNAVRLRPRAIFGKYDTTIVPRFLRVMKRGFFPLPDGGRARIDVTAVENITHVVWLILQSHTHFTGDVFNISNGDPMTVCDLSARLANAFGLKVRFVHVPSFLLMAAATAFEMVAKWRGVPEPMISRYAIQNISVTQTLSIEKAKRELGYTPVISTEDALEKLALWIDSESK